MVRRKGQRVERRWERVCIGYLTETSDLELQTQLKRVALAEACTTVLSIKEVYYYVADCWLYNDACITDLVEVQPCTWKECRQDGIKLDDWLVKRKISDEYGVCTAVLAHLRPAQPRPVQGTLPLALPVSPTYAKDEFPTHSALEGFERMSEPPSSHITVTVVFKDKFSWESRRGYRYGHAYDVVQLRPRDRFFEAREAIGQLLDDWRVVPRQSEHEFNPKTADADRMRKRKDGRVESYAPLLEHCHDFEEVRVEYWVMPRLKGCTQMWNWELGARRRAYEFVSADMLEDEDDEPTLYMEVHLLPKGEQSHEDYEEQPADWQSNDGLDPLDSEDMPEDDEEVIDDEHDTNWEPESEAQDQASENDINDKGKTSPAVVTSPILRPTGKRRRGSAIVAADNIDRAPATPPESDTTPQDEVESAEESAAPKGPPPISRKRTTSRSPSPAARKRTRGVVQKVVKHAASTGTVTLPDQDVIESDDELSARSSRESSPVPRKRTRGIAQKVVKHTAGTPRKPFMTFESEDDASASRSPSPTPRRGTRGIAQRVVKHTTGTRDAAQRVLRHTAGTPSKSFMTFESEDDANASRSPSPVSARRSRGIAQKGDKSSASTNAAISPESNATWRREHEQTKQSRQDFVAKRKRGSRDEKDKPHKRLKHGGPHRVPR